MFERPFGETMITDERVFEEGFVPGDVVHRHEQVNQLSGALRPLVDGGHPENALVFGPTGAGKTCAARYVLRELADEVPTANVGYVDCWVDYTRFRVLERALEAVGKAVDVHRRSTPTDELVGRLRDLDRPFVLVLDEADQLQEPAALGDLYRVPSVTLVCIANREPELFLGLDDRLTSRLRTATRVRFDRYGTDELVAILRARADEGLDPDAASDARLRELADAAAGDARVAIGALRAAALRASRHGREAIAREDTRAAVPEAETLIHERTVERLTDHQRVLYEIVRERGEVAPGELYAAYEERVDDPKSRRTLRTYLVKMAHYDLVEAEGEKRGRVYRSVAPDAADGSPATRR